MRINRKKTIFSERLSTAGDCLSEICEGTCEYQNINAMLKVALHNAKNGVTVENALEFEQVTDIYFVYMNDLEYGRQLFDGFGSIADS